MGNFAIRELEMGLKIIEPFFTEDNRGYFLKSYEKDIYRKLGIENELSEVFESYSHKDVIRGIHFQTKNPQIKIVRAVTGKILDVAVDLRKDSETFGKWFSVELSAENRLSLYIPKGFGHGFRVLSENAIVSYQCIGKYEKGSDTGIVWNDKTLAINWGIENPIVSERDNGLMRLAQYVKVLN